MIFFRVDGNREIGSGHIMRCISLAHEFSMRNEEVAFMVSDNNFCKTIEKNGYSYINLRTCWNDLNLEITQVQNILRQYEFPILIIDTYSVTKEYINSMKTYGRICYLGSLKKDLGELDFLINYSINIDHEFYKRIYTSKTVLLLGKQYAPLRREFQNREIYINPEVNSILVTTGNTDEDNITDVILSRIQLMFKQYMTIHVVIGSLFLHKEELKIKYGNCRNIILHENIDNMSVLMKKCDLAITANGTTVYELAAIGTPIVSYALVEEQVESAEELSNSGALGYCGKIYDDQKQCLFNMENTLKKYVQSYELRKEIATRANKMIDGYGCTRIVDKIL